MTEVTSSKVAPMDTSTHQERAARLAEWLEKFTACPGGVVGRVDTRGYVLPADWIFKKQAS